MSAGPRVLLVAQPTDGGVARCVAQLAVVAIARGFDVTLAAPPSGELAATVVAAGGTHVSVPMTRAPGVHDGRAVPALRRLCRDHDLVHLHSSKAGALGRVAIRSLGATAPPSLFTPHGWSWNAGGRAVPLYRAVERSLARWTDVVVAVSAEERDAGVAVLGSRARIVVVENGVDCAAFTPEGPVAPRGPEPLVVCVGRLANPKGQALAIAALAAMADRNARLRLVGDGPDRPALVEQAAALGVGDRVELVGHLDDPAPHLRAADVALVPSSSEGMSLAMLEAMACATPVVSTAVPGSGVIGDAGLTVPVGDATAMAAALDRLLAADDREGLGRLARERVVSAHRHDLALGRVVDLWRELLGSSRSRSVA